MADDVIGQYKLPGGSVVLINVYGMHHFPGYWEKPGEFYPAHFAPDNKKSLPAFSYLPFGGGQRLCIGHHFAMMVMQVVVIQLVLSFRFKVPEGFIPVIDPNLTLRAKEGIRLLIQQTNEHAKQPSTKDALH